MLLSRSAPWSIFVFQHDAKLHCGFILKYTTCTYTFLVFFRIALEKMYHLPNTCQRFPLSQISNTSRVELRVRGIEVRGNTPVFKSFAFILMVKMVALFSVKLNLMTFWNLICGVKSKLVSINFCKVTQKCCYACQNICNTEGGELAAIVLIHKSLLSHKELY